MVTDADRWEGVSEGDGASFAEAARDAADRAEMDLKRRKSWDPPVELKVVEMYVTVTNPVHDYRVVLGPGRP